VLPLLTLISFRQYLLCLSAYNDLIDFILVSEAPLSGSCASTGSTTVGVEPRRRFLRTAAQLHSWTVLVEQTGENVAVELDQVVSQQV